MNILGNELIKTVNYDNETDAVLLEDMDIRELADKLLDESLEFLGCGYECECSLLLTDAESIKRMNMEARNIDSVTDVLSFPMVDFPTPCDYSVIDENDFTIFNPDTGRLMLGDIVICPDRVTRQAEEYGHSVKRELSFLIVHSILHLFGYDHIDEKQRDDMEQMQRNILNRLNITR